MRIQIGRNGYLVGDSEGYSKKCTPQGATWHRHPDGRTVHFCADGSFTVYWHNGDKTWWKPTGEMHFTSQAYGYRITTYDDGDACLFHSNGAVSKKRTSGATQFSSSCGFTIRTHPTYPPQHVLITSPGYRFVTDFDTKRLRFPDNSKAAMHKDGSQHHVFADGTKLWRYFNSKKLHLEEPGGSHLSFALPSPQKHAERRTR